LEFRRVLFRSWVHYMFDLMVMVGMYSLVVTFVYIICTLKKKWNPHKKWLLTLLVLNGPLAMLGIEFGWIYAEVGRQPWILRGYMKVSEASTTSPHVGKMFLLFLALYILLGILCVVVLRKMFKNNPVDVELQERFPSFVEEDTK